MLAMPNEPSLRSVTDRMLHERIRDQNEVAREPTTERDRDRSREMATRSESFLAPDQRTDECALEKEREHPFHRQRLSDHAAGILGKAAQFVPN